MDKDILKGIIAGFTHVEIEKLNSLFRQYGGESLDDGFYQKITINFNGSSSRDGKPEIDWEKVKDWFENKQNESFPAMGTSSSKAFKEADFISEHPLLKNRSETSPMPTGLNIMDLSGLRFEALSLKDDAWYDVASFISFRYMNTGELEVRARFAGFNNDQDEWVNVRTGVRKRSIPLEGCDCELVNHGDLVLCFQERLEQAVYCDAHVVEVERNPHDISGACKCVFTVQYLHNNTKEKLVSNRLCRRPGKDQFDAF